MSTSVASPETPAEVRRKSSDASDWSDYNLEWLFDPDRIDHLPVEEQLTQFQQRDLKKPHFYKTAAKIFGAPRSRKRVIVAQAGEPSRLAPLATGGIQSCDNTLKPRVIPPVTTPPELVKAREEREKLDSYHKWINQRKEFRRNLDSMGVSEEWLARKPDKTPLEQRVLTRMIDERTRRPETPPPPEEPPLEPVLPEESPTVRRPSPLAIKIFERFLHQKKMRLIDLFQSVDKDKSWTVTRTEFRQAIKQTKVPISDVLWEDLILTLDIDLNDVLDYRELAKGMGLWKIEKRESKHQMVTSNEVNASPTKFSKANGYAPPDVDADVAPSPENITYSPSKPSKSKSPSDNTSKGDTKANIARQHSRETPVEARARSAVSSESCGSSASGSKHLEPPEPDTRAEQMILSSPEAMLDLRKQSKQVLSRYDKGKLTDSDTTVVKTMDAAADRHLIPTTLTGDTAELLHKFRQLKYREYNDVCALCEERNIPLTESLLQKVLLYPNDKPHSQLKKKIRQPAMPLITKKFHESAPSPTGFTLGSRSRSPVPTGSSKVKSKAMRTEKRVVSERQSYPNRADVAVPPRKQHLSTGRALIDKKVDCWTTFEEYDRLTRHLEKKYHRVNSTSDQNAFWPGQLLDKVRLCMPDSVSKSSAIFQQVGRRTKMSCLIGL